MAFQRNYKEKSMNSVQVLLISSVLLVTPVMLANSLQDSQSSLPPLLPQEREIALAESAGPSHIAKGATIYVLERGGFVVAREGTNGFSCLVLRSLPGTQEPECLDAEGTAAVLPRYLDKARYREEGLSRPEVRAKIAEGFRSGKYRSPGRPGIIYMLSCENYVAVDEAGERIINYQPHVMFFAPGLTNEELGAGSGDRWMPFVIEEGSPVALIIVPVGEDLAAPRCPAKK